MFAGPIIILLLKAAAGGLSTQGLSDMENPSEACEISVI